MSFLANGVSDGIQRIKVGPAEILWLPAATVLPEGAFDLLHPDEHAYAATFGASERRAEYLRARWLIRALSGFQGPLSRSTDGVQTYPPGYAGSLTHKSGSVAVAMLQDSAVRTVGIDAERVDRVKPAFAPKILNDRETALLHAEQERTGLPFATLLALAFSFKEALFKCLFPLERVWFYFHDAEITEIAPAEGKITAKLALHVAHEAPMNSFHSGYYKFFEDADRTHFILTAVLI